MNRFEDPSTIEYFLLGFFTGVVFVVIALWLTM